MQNQVIVDVYDAEGNKIDEKSFYDYEGREYYNELFLSDWRKYIDIPNLMGHLSCGPNDFGGQNSIFITNKIVSLEDRKDRKYRGTLNLHKDNLLFASIYFAVRHCIRADWLNDRDQFLYPVGAWDKDTEFQNDCLAFTLFHTQNRISCKIAINPTEKDKQGTFEWNTQKSGSNNGYHINHWIPFTEQEVGANDDFCSHFMSDYIADKDFSEEARGVISAGKEVWRYYHKCFQKNEYSQADPNIKGENDASLYDIKEYFKGRNEKGSVRQKSNDADFNALMDDLQKRIAQLAIKIKPKVYEYGFLM